MNRLGYSCFALFLIGFSQAQSIVGPQQGSPSQQLVFRLMNGSTQLTVDHWVQELNPDRYTGNDYVTSFALQMQPLADGTLTVTAASPGRYKIAAWRGTDRWVTYVLIRPDKVVPAIRGAAFSAFEPLNRPYVSRVLANAKRLGMTWAELVETAFIDFDSGSLQVQAYCQKCPGSMSLADLAWLIDEAHNQGFQVVVEPGVWARSKGVLDELESTLEGIPLNAAPWPDTPNKPIDPKDPSIIPAVMQSYSTFMVQMAQVAQQHHAEAIIVGDNVSSPNHVLLWGQQQPWTDLFSQMRRAFPGKLWVGPTWTCPSQAASFGSFVTPDGYHDFASGDIASVPSCTFPLAGPNNPTADEIAARISPWINTWRAFQLRAQTHLPVIYTDFYTVNVDGMNYLSGPGVYSLVGRAPQDNQEIVDLFEAAMATIFQQTDAAFFLWSVGLSENGWGNSQDPLRQPELANAIANWWGGDVASLAPCLISNPAGVIFRDNFDLSPCPLMQQDLAMALGGDWAPGPDPLNSENWVLHGSGNGFANFGDLSNSPWTNYTLKVRERLVGGSNPVGMLQFRITSDHGDFNGYGVHFGRGQVILYKSVHGQSQLLASYSIPGGTPLGMWAQIEADVIGATITVGLNGKQIIQYADQNAPLLHGAVSLGAYGGSPGPNLVDFGDIDMEAAGSAAPSGPAPLTAFLTPTGANAAGGTFTLTVNGANFVSTSMVQWNGSTRPTTFVNSNQLKAAIPASDIANSGTAQLTVVNPFPGAGASNGVLFLITYTVSSKQPTIASPAGVLNAAEFQPAIAPGSWVTIKGTNLANTSPGRIWRPDEIVNGNLPTALDGVSVTINGQPAFVYYISPTQINVLAPADTTQGPVSVVVNNNGSLSAPATVRLQTFSPAFFPLGETKYAIATRFPDNALIANPSVFPGAVAARPGDIVTLWGTGFGPTNPPTTPGIIVTNAAAPTLIVPAVTVGETAVTVIGAAISPGSAGLYQVAVQLPMSISSEDLAVHATVAGISSPGSLSIYVSTN